MLLSKLEIYIEVNYELYLDKGKSYEQFLELTRENWGRSAIDPNSAIDSAKHSAS